MTELSSGLGDVRQPAGSRTDAGNGANDDVWTKLGRAASVTGEGILGLGYGIEHAVQNESIGKLAMTAGSSALLGIAMRTLLPEAGAVTKAVSLAMSLSFASDAAKPMYQGWKAVWNDSSTEAHNKAVSTIADGLGDFTVDGAVSMLGAGFAVKRTPILWNKMSPTAWHKIESWKTDMLGDQSTIGSAFAATGDWVSTKISAAADQIHPTPKLEIPSHDEIAKVFGDLKLKLSTRAFSHKMYREGVTGINGYAHGHNTSIDLLMAGKDPHVVEAKVPAGSKPLSEVDLAQKDSFVVTDSQTEGSGIKRQAKAPNDKTESQPNANSGPSSDWSKVLSADTMTQMAKVIGKTLAGQADEQGIIEDHVNYTTGAVATRTSKNVKALEGYEEPVQSMMALGEEALKDPRVFVQVQDLMRRFAHAAIQSGTGDATADFANRYALLVADIGAHIFSMNQYAKENFTTYLRNIIQAGIDPKVALKQKAVAPLVEATSDLEQVGVDKNGRPQYVHQGPHTVRSVYGPNGEPIWPIDLVKYPIREVLLRALMTAGIYGHEFMHDQFGRLGEFEPAVRDEKLPAAAAKALGDKANDKIDLPNGGVDPQQVLLNNIARRASQITDAKQREAFLTQSLGLDQVSKVMRAAQTAGEILGDGATRKIKVPGTGDMNMDVFVGNIAAMADDRSATQVLAELQGKGDPAATAKAVRDKIDRILGQNGSMQVQIADGSTAPLRDVVAAVSDAARDPHFDTYDKPLPQKITWTDLLVGIAEGWADETFADWGAAAESGQTAAPYFQALREDGLLSRSTVMAQEMRHEGNPLGVEAHPVDKLRPRYQAALIRALATAKGQRDQLLLDYADALDKYSRDAGQSGPIQIANMDAPGQKITIPEDVFDKFIAELVQQQLSTPLPRLQGKTLFDILPDLRKNFRINNDMADSWVKAIQAGQSPDTIPFDITAVKQTHVYGAGHLAFLKLVAAGMDADQANAKTRAFLDYFSHKYLGGDPHTTTPFTTRLRLAPQQTLVREVPRTAARVAANTLRAHAPLMDYLGSYGATISGAGTNMLLQDILDLHHLQEQIMAESQKLL